MKRTQEYGSGAAGRQIDSAINVARVKRRSRIATTNDRGQGRRQTRKARLDQ